MSKQYTLSNYINTGFNRINEYEDYCIVSKLLPEHNDPQHKTLFGLEIEVENVDRIEAVKAAMATAKGDNHLPLLWVVKSDGSLRNYGVEFVSYKTIHLESMSGVLNWLYSFLKSTYKLANFSSRCGTHMHVDVNDFSIEQFNAFIKLYLIYENFFFNYSSPERKNSNFCVPLSKTNFFTWCNEKNSITWDNFFMHIPGKDYSKYSALNFTRLVDLGTLEFRHMRPTWDVNRIVTIAKVIQKIKFYSEGSKNQELINSFIKEANTISNYDWMTREIFGKELAPTIMDYMDNTDFSEGVTTAKVFLFQNGFKKTKAKITELFNNTQFTETISKFKKESEPKVSPEEWIGEDINLDVVEVPRRHDGNYVVHPGPQPVAVFHDLFDLAGRPAQNIVRADIYRVEDAVAQDGEQR